ncbi:flavoprotein [Nocardiopsis ganjiahuensis]|uniref:flavoprotein n=1 Tax=Nocardiopsis ganjiahuensis TaxID=239984 RepID=UPI0003455AE9|nr:flavoprotein [Nocardiopsis ganjiahuensis]
MPISTTLYVVVCAAGPAGHVDRLIRPVQARGWQVQAIATPAAVDFFDVGAIEELTGRPVRSQHRGPNTPRSPKADAVVVAPASFNTINKLAAGIADNYALDVLNETIGLGVPVTILPFVNAAYAGRGPFRRSVAALEEEGVGVLMGEGGFVPHPAGQGSDAFDRFPWDAALEDVEERIKDSGNGAV